MQSMGPTPWVDSLQRRTPLNWGPSEARTHKELVLDLRKRRFTERRTTVRWHPRS